MGAAATFEYYAGLADTFPFEEQATPTAGGQFGLLVREPVGVVGAIIPWNAPIGLIANKVAPALIAGCTVVLKASPEAPGEAYVVAEVAESIGLPPGVLNVVTADREVSELLVRDPRVDKITFTGSTAGRPSDRLDLRRADRPLHARAGRQVGRGGPRRHRPRRRRRHAGQGRVLPDRPGVLVADPDHRVALAPRRAGRGPGRPLRHGAGRRPVRSPSRRWARSWPSASATGCWATSPRASTRAPPWSTGGGRPAHLDRGWFVEPTVFANVDNSSTIAQEEIFGPVLTRHPGRRRGRRRAPRQRHHLRAERLGVHRRRRPGPPGRRPAALGHGRPQRLPHRLRHRLRRVQAVRASAARAAPKACCRSWSPRRSSSRAPPTAYNR